MEITGEKVTNGLFVVNFSYLVYNIIQRVSLCEAISGSFVVSAPNYCASTLDNIVMQTRKANCNKACRFERALVKSLAAILNLSYSGRLERERKFYQGGE